MYCMGKPVIPSLLGVEGKTLVEAISPGGDPGYSRTSEEGARS